MYEIYCNLRDSRGIKDARVAEATGIGKSTFSDWKSGRSVPKQDKLKKIADYFGVPIEYFSNSDNGLITCKDCGLMYDSSYPNDVEEHRHQHEAWKRAVDKFGQLYCYYPECEKTKTENRKISQNTSLPLNQRLDAQIEIFKCLFSRSVMENNFDLNHVPFDVYVSMLLGNSTINQDLETDLKELLVQKYGTRTGINYGTVYHIPNMHENTIAAHKDGDNFTLEELEKIEEYKKLLIAARQKG
jgi:transcriptional regulator with XRE-family HTH domain